VSGLGADVVLTEWPLHEIDSRVNSLIGSPEQFTPEERAALEPYFTNLDSQVFALTNLPETVKGALFTRYSRSAKSLRRLFLDEFLDGLGVTRVASSEVGVTRANRLYARVLNDYGDDSVAQLGGAHLACEGVSNILTKVLEHGRLMSYLEQSTRYVPYLDRQDGAWKYLVPSEFDGQPLRKRYVQVLDNAFDLYARLFDPLQEYFRLKHPKQSEDSDRVYRAAIRAKALDTLRGLLPAATQSNVGIYGSGQAYEALILRMLVHPLAEARTYASAILSELRKVIPAFLTRVDLPERGQRWSRYLAETRRDVEFLSNELVIEDEKDTQSEVSLTDYDPEGEIKVVAASLYSVSHLSDAKLLVLARQMTSEQRERVLKTYVGQRTNRRHKPGRAFERTRYRFDILTDYGAFRDLQRHRLLTTEWQALTPRHGYVEPVAIADVGVLSEWRCVMNDSADLYHAIVKADFPDVASYAVTLAHRVRFYLDLDAREAMHIIELRSAPQGHATYRRICQAMHRLIKKKAGHRAIASAMAFVDHSAGELERLNAERESERRRRRADQNL